MARYKRGRRKSTSAATNAKIRYLPPKANTQKAQILALNKKVNENSRKLRGLRYKVQHATRLALNIVATPANPYAVLEINAPSNLQQIFSAPSESAGGAYNMDKKGRTHLTFDISVNNEMDPMPLTVFIIRPKTSKVAVSAGINVPGTTFTLLNNVDYVNNVAAGTYINKKRWHIDKHWNINLNPIRSLSSGVPAQWEGQLLPVRRVYNGRNVLVLNNRTGLWSDTADHAVNPTQRQFLVVFTKNVSATATYPILNGMVLHTAYTSE